MSRAAARQLLAAGSALLVVAGVLAGQASAGAASPPAAPPAAQAPDDDPYGGSAATVSGRGRFQDLTVTVDKTTNLANESVDVSWQWGGEDTASRSTPGTGYPYNFMQVFQCWGDGSEGAEGPPREQCQFGGNWGPSSDYFNLTPQSGQWFDTGYVVSRTVSRPGNQRPDPLEEAAGSPYRYDPAVPGSGVVPMRAAPAQPGAEPRVVTSPTTNVFFDRTITNEVPVAQTSADGSGSTSIELHTRVESPFLGCGDRTAAGGTRPCYLVVVPRDNVEVSGVSLPAIGQFRAGAMLGSSPLSQSNWDNRVVFPLQFLPLRETCQLGTVERSIVGQEALATAFLSWQSVLCRRSLPLFYASTVDDLARRSALDRRPQLSVVTDPVPPGTAAPQGSLATTDDLVYAPVGISGVTVAFFIERQYTSATRPEVLQSYDGTRATELRLTPRLVAKLLTQSYGASVFSNGAPDYFLTPNIPASLIRDPEFRAVNTPTDGQVDPLTDIANVAGADKDFATLLMPTTSSDAIRALWTWVLADQDARAFLDGDADDFGMTVNPDFEGLDRFLGPDGRPRADIDRPDEPCKTVGVGAGTTEEARLCNGDANPLTRSFDEAAVLTARGQPVGSESLEKNPATGAVRVSRPGPQFPGQRTMLALTTTASAARLGLTTAALQNSSGGFVRPTVASMSAAAALAEATDVAGVDKIDPAAMTGDAYPLTTYSYAVTNPALLDEDARRDYASTIEYAVSDGQVPGIDPGDLPPGYAPLPADDRALARANAAAVRDYRTPAAPPAATAPSGAAATSVAAPVPRGAGGAVQAQAPRPATTPPFAAAPARPVAPAAAAVPSQLPVLGPPVPVAAPPAAEPVALVRASATTPTTDVALRLLLPAVLALGLVAALTGGGFVAFGKGGLVPRRSATVPSPVPLPPPVPLPSPVPSASPASIASSPPGG